MTGEIITAVLALIGTIIGSGSGVLLIKYRIEQLEKKLDKYSDSQEEIKERLVIVEQSTKSAHHRLDDFAQQLKLTETRKDR